MSSVQNEKEQAKETQRHEAGAFAAWGMIGGGAAGLLVGIFVDNYLVLPLSAGLVGWLVGALIERARR